MKKNKNSNYLKNGFKNISFVALFVLGSLSLLYFVTDSSRHIKELTHTVFWQYVDTNQVKEIRIAGQEVRGILRNGTPFEVTLGNDPAMWERFKQRGVDVAVVNTTSAFSLWYIIPILLLILTFCVIWYMTRQSRNTNGSGAGGIFNMSKSRARLFMPSTIKESFESVAGAAEAKEELKDIVDFLKNPEKYERLGAKMTRGVLLVGAPGNGKTLLARAVAGEASCPFLSVSGSDFIEVFVGVGAGRVRDLFTQARKNSPSIIFIDEIDAVGRQRGTGLGGGNDEREQTLNQLLTEMDGFQTNNNSVIVIAATNRPDVLDPALLRPGRFDRHVHVPYPDLKSRTEILAVHCKSVKMSPQIDLQKIARGTSGFSGADLANLVNESAIIASKQNQSDVTIADFEEARDKILLGKERKTIVMTEADKEMTAYHEAGHALVRLLMPNNTDPLHKVTIIPRGKALGVTHYLPERDKHSLLKEELIANIIAALGGRAAEEIVFSRVSTGAESDFTAATRYARSMVCNYGMSDSLGLVVYSQEYGAFPYSQAIAERIDTEVQNILDQCYSKAKELLVGNRDKLDLLSRELLDKETLYAAEIYELLNIEARADLRFS